VAVEIRGAAPGTRLGELRRVGHCARTTFVFTVPFFAPLPAFKKAYDRIAQTGWGFPLSEFEALPGKRAHVVDVGLLAAADGGTVAQLAKVLDPGELEAAFTDVREIEFVHVSLVGNAQSRRDIQDLADSNERENDLVTQLGRLLGDLRWLIVLVLVAAIAIAGWKGMSAWKR
jgi:hypothetical protein